MEHSIQYYRDLLQFLTLATEQERRNFSYEEGIELSPDYWMAIVVNLKERRLINANYGNVYIHQFLPLIPLIADCRTIIQSMEKAEEDRILDRRYKLKGILYGRTSLIISILALGISLYSAFR